MFAFRRRFFSFLYSSISQVNERPFSYFHFFISRFLGCRGLFGWDFHWGEVCRGWFFFRQICHFHAASSASDFAFFTLLDIHFLRHIFAWCFSYDFPWVHFQPFFSSFRVLLQVSSSSISLGFFIRAFSSQAFHSSFLQRRLQLSSSAFRGWIFLRWCLVFISSILHLLRWAFLELFIARFSLRVFFFFVAPFFISPHFFDISASCLVFAA